MDKDRECLSSSESSTSSTTSSSGGIGWDWGYVLNSTDLQAVSGQGSDGRLSAWAWGLGVSSSSSSQLDVDGIDSNVLQEFANVLSGKHCYKVKG